MHSETGAHRASPWPIFGNMLSISPRLSVCSCACLFVWPCVSPSLPVCLSVSPRLCLRLSPSVSPSLRLCCSWINRISGISRVNRITRIKLIN